MTKQETCPNKENGWMDCHEVQALAHKNAPLCARCQSK